MKRSDFFDPLNPHDWKFDDEDSDDESAILEEEVLPECSMLELEGAEMTVATDAASWISLRSRVNAIVIKSMMYDRNQRADIFRLLGPSMARLTTHESLTPAQIASATAKAVAEAKVLADAAAASAASAASAAALAAALAAAAVAADISAANTEALALVVAAKTESEAASNAVTAALRQLGTFESYMTSLVSQGASEDVLKSEMLNGTKLQTVVLAARDTATTQAKKSIVSRLGILKSAHIIAEHDAIFKASLAECDAYILKINESLDKIKEQLAIISAPTELLRNYSSPGTSSTMNSAFGKLKNWAASLKVASEANKARSEAAAEVARAAKAEANATAADDKARAEEARVAEVNANAEANSFGNAFKSVFKLFKVIDGIIPDIITEQHVLDIAEDKKNIQHAQDMWIDPTKAGQIKYKSQLKQGQRDKIDKALKQAADINTLQYNGLIDRMKTLSLKYDLELDKLITIACEKTAQRLRVDGWADEAEVIYPAILTPSVDMNAFIKKIRAFDSLIDEKSRTRELEQIVTEHQTLLTKARREANIIKAEIGSAIHRNGFSIKNSMQSLRDAKTKIETDLATATLGNAHDNAAQAETLQKITVHIHAIDDILDDAVGFEEKLVDGDIMRSATKDNGWRKTTNENAVLSVKTKAAVVVTAAAAADAINNLVAEKRNIMPVNEAAVVHRNAVAVSVVEAAAVASIAVEFGVQREKAAARAAARDLSHKLDEILQSRGGLGKIDAMMQDSSVPYAEEAIKLLNFHKDRVITLNDINNEAKNLLGVETSIVDDIWTSAPKNRIFAQLTLYGPARKNIESRIKLYMIQENLLDDKITKK